MTVDDTVIVTAFSVAWGAVVTAIIALWRKASECEEHRTKLEHEMSELRSLKTLIESCPAPRCPYDDKPKRETTRVHLRPSAA